MKKTLIAGLLIATAMSIVFIVGCGDDDKSGTGPTEKQVGDLNDPEFLQAMDVLDETGDISGMMFEAILFAIDSVLSGAGPGSPGERNRQRQLAGIEADSVSVTMVYHEPSQYWYFHIYMRGEDSDTTTITMDDSIQFLHGTEPVQWPDPALLTRVNNGAYLNMTSTAGDHAIAGQLLTVTGELLTNGDITVNGTQSLDYTHDSDADSCTYDLDMTVTATEMQLNIANMEEGCPDSGVMRHHGTVAIECTGPYVISYSETWTVTETYTGNNTVTVVAENSTTRWTYSGNCLD